MVHEAWGNLLKTHKVSTFYGSLLPGFPHKDETAIAPWSPKCHTGLQRQNSHASTAKTKVNSPWGISENLQTPSTTLIIGPRSAATQTIAGASKSSLPELYTAPGTLG